METFVKAYFIVNILGALFQLLKEYLGEGDGDEYAKSVYHSLNFPQKVSAHILTFIINVAFWLPIKIGKALTYR